MSNESTIKVEALVQAHPLYQVLTSMPGIGGQDRSRHPGRDPGQGPRHRRPAGLLRRPGTGNPEIRLLHKGRARLPRRQQEAQARHIPVRLRLPGSDPVSRAYYQRKRDQDKRHNQAVLALAHRRLTHHIGPHYGARAPVPATHPRQTSSDTLTQ